MITDGTEYQHDLTKRGHYDQVWAALNGTDLSMLGEHEFPGGRYRILDRQDMELGWVTFTETEKPEFTGGYWFGALILAGRTLNRRQALAEFLNEITTTHPGRIR